MNIDGNMGSEPQLKFPKQNIKCFKKNNLFFIKRHGFGFKCHLTESHPLKYL